MTETKTRTWTPYLVSLDGKHRVRLILAKEYHSIPEIQEFFRNMPATHPELVGKRIDFEEEPEQIRIVVPGD